jgi:hypothetical protein
MTPTRSCEISVKLYRPTWRHNPEDITSSRDSRDDSYGTFWTCLTTLGLITKTQPVKNLTAC